MSFNVTGKNFKESHKNSHWKCFTKKSFLKVSQYSQENSALESLINLEAQLFSYEYSKIFQNTYSEEHLQISEVSREIAFASISLFYAKI